ncbi:MAG: 3-phosphoglycerate dehydrogenase, partial [Synergistetes bacterium HGW-Synergistetes-2]
MQRNGKALTMVFVLLAVMVSFVFAQGVEEVAYPAKGIEVNVGYSAGGATDIAARLVAPYMEAKLGQPITILNKPGAGGEIAHSALGKATPDGYYLGYI